MNYKINQNNIHFLKSGGIHINPKNKGKFTATKKKTGKSTEELTHSKNPLTRKRAVFAQNAKKWKHEEGGEINNKELIPRKALARTFKKMAKARKHQDGGLIDFLMPLIEQYKKGGKLSKEYIKKAHEKPGGSNVGKKTFASGAKRTGPYVGPSGGAPKGSYPIPDKKHAKSALSLAHHAPNPAGIKAAVYRKYPELKKHATGGILDNTIGYLFGGSKTPSRFFLDNQVDQIKNVKKLGYSLISDYGPLSNVVNRWNKNSGRNIRINSFRLGNDEVPIKNLKYLYTTTQNSGEPTRLKGTGGFTRRYYKDLKSGNTYVTDHDFINYGDYDSKIKSNKTELTGTKGAASWGLLTPLVNAIDQIGTPFVQSTGVYRYGNTGKINLNLDAPDIKSDKNAFIEKFKSQ